MFSIHKSLHFSDAKNNHSIKLGTFNSINRMCEMHRNERGQELIPFEEDEEKNP